MCAAGASGEAGRRGHSALPGARRARARGGSRARQGAPEELGIRVMVPYHRISVWSQAGTPWCLTFFFKWLLGRYW